MVLTHTAALVSSQHVPRWTRTLHLAIAPNPTPIVAPQCIAAVRRGRRRLPRQYLLRIPHTRGLPTGQRRSLSQALAYCLSTSLPCDLTVGVYDCLPGVLCWVLHWGLSWVL